MFVAISRVGLRLHKLFSKSCTARHIYTLVDCCVRKHEVDGTFEKHKVKYLFITWIGIHVLIEATAL